MKSKKGKNFSRVSIAVGIRDRDGKEKPVQLCQGCSVLIWEALDLENQTDEEDQKLREALGHPVKISLDGKKS